MVEMVEIRRSRRGDAFTIIELIVTLASIVVCVTLLVPSFSQSKERERRIQCQSNVLRIGAALRLYTSEQYILIRDGTTNTSLEYKSGWPWDMETNLVGKLEAKGVVRRTLYCPSNPSMDDDAHWNYWQGHPETPIRVLGYIFPFDGGMLFLPHLKQPTATDAKDPSEIELVVDVVASMAGDYTHIQGAFLDRTSHLKGRRPTGGNIAFADGHVAWRAFRDMQHRTAPGAGVTWDF